jgi:hypothetical protein
VVDGDLRLDLEERVLFVGGGHHLETMGGLEPSEIADQDVLLLCGESWRARLKVGRLSLLHCVSIAEVAACDILKTLSSSTFLICNPQNM